VQILEVNAIWPRALICNSPDLARAGSRKVIPASRVSVIKQAQWEEMMKLGSLLAGIPLVCVTIAPDARATVTTLTFTGVDLNIVGEFINAVPVPESDWQFADLFEPAQGHAIQSYVTYNPNQRATSQSSGSANYDHGRLSVRIPSLGLFGLALSRSGGYMQLSSFLSAQQFFVGDNSGSNTFSSKIGLPDPISFDTLYFGPSMLSTINLPTSNLDWTFANLSFEFLDANDDTERQVLLTFTPRTAPAEPAFELSQNSGGSGAVPEPSTWAMMVLGFAGLGFAGYRAARTKKTAIEL
jgi:hypothetical protein